MRFDHRKTQAYQERLKQEQWSPYVRERKTVATHGPKQVRFPIEDLHKHKGLIARTCPTCGKDFAIYKCVTTKTNQSWCSKECSDNKSVVKMYERKMATKNLKSKVRKTLNRKGFFKSRKEEYKDKIVKYIDSPTGKAYIGINKEPLMPAAEKGYGYQGVLIQDENREYIQCHSCGKWMQKLSILHTQKCCGLTTRQYKEKYGLNKELGLVSDETSLRLTKACLKNKDKEAKIKLMKKWQGKVKQVRGKHSMEFFNKYGTCPLQLKTRLYEFIRCNRELPSQGDKGRPIYKALRRRFGSYSHALTAHGLPFMKRQGTNMKFVFSDGTIYQYNMNQFYDREALYKMMMEKCPVLLPS